MFSIGIDFGGTKILIGIINQDGEIIKSIKRNVPRTKHIDEIIELTSATIEDLFSDSKISLSNISGIGVAAPGIVDADKGILIYAPNWSIRNFPIKKIFSDKYSMPVKVYNDVNAAAIGELHFGHGREENSFFWITISTGIGGALVINGELLLGNSGLAGEIGHIIIEDNGPLCKCGRKGCLESLASGTAIASLARKKIKNGAVFHKIDPKINIDEITAETVIMAAHADDGEAISLLEEVARNISKALSYVVNLADVDLMVIGGGVMESNGLLFKFIDKNMKRYVYEYDQRNVKLARPALGYNSSLVGAGALILKDKNL